MQKITNIHSNC